MALSAQLATPFPAVLSNHFAVSIPVPTDQDIREICSRVIHAQDIASFQTAIAELKIAIRDHTVRAENRSRHLILQMNKVKDELKNGTSD